MRDRMEYAHVSLAEQEVTIRLDRTDSQAHLCSTWPAWSRKLERRYGSPRKVTKSSRDGKITSAFWTVPVRLVSLRRPRVPRPRTIAEQAASQAAADRFRGPRTQPP